MSRDFKNALWAGVVLFMWSVMLSGGLSTAQGQTVMVYCSAQKHPGKVVQVVDGDTLEIQLDLGYDTKLDVTFDLFEVKTKGATTTIFVKRWVKEHQGVVIVQNAGRSQNGSWLARVCAADGECLNDELVVAGRARYTGR